MHEHVLEMVGGEFALGNISYDELQKLKAREQELLTKPEMWEGLKEIGKLPSDFNFDNFCRKYVRVIVEKE